MNQERLDEIRERVAKATPGPWRVINHPLRTGVGGIAAVADDELIVETDSGYYPPMRPDADFIAHARQDVPDLLAEVARLMEWKTNVEASMEERRE